MKIALIWPKGFDTSYVLPLSLAYLISNIGNGKHKIKIFDCALMGIDSSSPKFSRIIDDFSPQIVGVSCWSNTFSEALNIIRVVKSINSCITTVIGGCHASSYPDQVMEQKEIDFLFRGEAEFSFQLFLDELEKKEPNWSIVKGLLYRSSDGNNIKNDIKFEESLDRISIPDYDSINLEKYIEHGYRYNSPVKRNAPIIATRGCPYRCNFCSAPIINGKKIRKHSVEYMREWIKYLYEKKNIKWFSIIDDNFTFDADYAKAFCQEIINLGLKDIGFANPNGVRLQRGNPELWALMKLAGWRTIHIAPESGSNRVLKLMKKDLNPDIVPGVVEDIKASGLKVQAFFLLGYPGESIDDIKKTSELIKKCRFNFVFFQSVSTTTRDSGLQRVGSKK